MLKASSQAKNYQDGPQREPNFTIAQSSSLPQILLAIIQIADACYTLAINTGDEIDRNGFASYRLTVVPYAIMSFINLLTPSYPCIYLVHTSILHEAQGRGNVFTGTLGHMPDEHLNISRTSKDLRIRRVDCDTHFRQIPPGIPASRGSTSQIQGPLNVCFNRRCASENVHISITEQSGKYVADEKHSDIAAYVITSAIGLVAIAAPIVLVSYVGRYYPTDIPLRDKLPVPLWYVLGDIIGIVPPFLSGQVDVLLHFKGGYNHLFSTLGYIVS